MRGRERERDRGKEFKLDKLPKFMHIINPAKIILKFVCDEALKMRSLLMAEQSHSAIKKKTKEKVMHSSHFNAQRHMNHTDHDSCMSNP